MTYIIPIAHPAWVFRGNWAHSRLQPGFIAKGKEIAESGRYLAPNPEDYPANANLYPTIGDLHGFSNTLNSCTVDIECAGDYLVCVGLLNKETYSYTCVRFRQLGGDIYDPNSLTARANWLFMALADGGIKKTFHNGQAFDIPYLENQGFVVNGFENDTMLQAHLTYGRELPKKLNFLALVIAGIPNWKTLVSEEDEVKEK